MTVRELINNLLSNASNIDAEVRFTPTHGDAQFNILSVTSLDKTVYLEGYVVN